MNLKQKGKFFFRKLIGLVFFVSMILLYSCKSGNKKINEPINNIKEYRKLRNELLQRPRLIHNNDGNDANSFPIKKIEYISDSKERPRPTVIDSVKFKTDYTFSIDNFLNIRTKGLVGSNVTTISYCTISSGFSHFTHNTKLGEILQQANTDYPERKNIVPEMLKLGTDPLKITCEFVHQNKLEIFWSNRMNDTHDSEHSAEKPHYLFPKFKLEHPEYLMGNIEERVPTRWSSVDFRHQEVRDLCLAFFTEVCENYNVDGIELDFFRHLFLFGNVARYEGVATNEQLNMLTDMVEKIRKMTERVGMERGRPILISVRVPDSFEYCESVGIALMNWLEKELVDIVIGSGYFRLNLWRDMVNAISKYDAKYYAGFDESRIRDGQHPYLNRSNNAVYRARAAAAWEAGVDGISIFNEYNTRAKYLSEIGEPEKLNNTNNLYFINYRGTPKGGLSDPNFYLKDGKQHFNLPLINPLNPMKLDLDSIKFSMEIGKETSSANVFIILYTNNVNCKDIDILVNNKNGVFKNITSDGLCIFEISKSAFISGTNYFKIINKGDLNKKGSLLDVAVLFLRDSADPELKELITICS